MHSRWLRGWSYSMIRQIEAGFAVAPQLSLADVTAAADRFALIVNNRPDGEEPSASQGEEIESDAGGPVLAYCRSGTRSCFLWALTRARGGTDPDTLSSQAAAAGYDLSPIRPMLDALAKGAR